MRIAFLVPVFPAPSQTFVLNQIQGLIELGHDITIFSRQVLEKEPADHGANLNNLSAITCYFRDYYFETRSLNRFSRIFKLCVQVIKIFPRRPLAILRACRFVFIPSKKFTPGHFYQIIPFYEYEKFDILYCHFGDLGLFGLWLKKLKIFDSKLVTVFHGYDLSTYLQQKGPGIYANLFKNGDLFLPISKYWKRKLIELGCPPEKIRVHRMGTDIGRFKYIERKITNRPITLLSVARLVDKKGIQFGIQATAKLVNEFPTIRYLIAGDGPLMHDLMKMVDKLDLNENVNFLGWQSPDAISVLMRDADILLAPSVTGIDGDMEGLPVVLMEACASGLPVLSTYHSGIPELIQDAVTGLLAQERDVDQLYEKLRWLILNPEKRVAMAKAAHGSVKQHYDVSRLNERLVSLFEGLNN